MFEQLARMAEQMATNTSRRQFLGRLGRVAAGAVTVLGSLLLLSKDAVGRGVEPCIRCYYGCPNGTYFYIDRGRSCPRTYDGCRLVSKEPCGGR